MARNVSLNVLDIILAHWPSTPVDCWMHSRCLYRLVVHIVFGTINNATATASEAELSKSVQAAFANFVKNPGGPSPAPNWPAYEADASVLTLAKIAYHGNVQLPNFVEPVDPSSMVSIGTSKPIRIHLPSFYYQEGPCQAWDPFLDFRP
jgi:hypothetical protein